ncbi:MAG: lipase [Clostridia bacterium]|nr:lipase [Clostridia bacterium]
MSTPKWVAIWGNAVSIAENRPERYARNITLRYPVRIPFDGQSPAGDRLQIGDWPSVGDWPLVGDRPPVGGTPLRLTFDNFCGENRDADDSPVTIAKTTLLVTGSRNPADRFYPVTFAGERSVTIAPGKSVTSDPVEVSAAAGETVYVSFYLADFTLMRSVVYTCGPLSGGMYANGDQTETVQFDVNTSRVTKLNYFLSNVSLLTAEENRAIVCYGDSITAQDWPDYLQLRCAREGFGHTAIIRRAASGTRILREYTCLTYESYGLMGSKRFEREVPTDGADAVIIQQGINDIIHPVGTDVNIFRPMSDLPTVEELIEGLKTYIAQARRMGLRVYVGTLLPMGGWRTDAPFRQEMRHAYNDFIRTTDLIDGCIDFDKALRDPARPDWFLPEYDSGDHLHPSKKGYERMAAEVPEELLK